MNTEFTLEEAKDLIDYTKEIGQLIRFFKMEKKWVPFATSGR